MGPYLAENMYRLSVCLNIYIDSLATWSIYGRKTLNSISEEMDFQQKKSIRVKSRNLKQKDFFEKQSKGRWNIDENIFEV